MLPFDLHVLGLPPAFTLSQDQTLHLNFLTPPCGFVKALSADFVPGQLLELLHLHAAIELIWTLLRTSARWTTIHSPDARTSHLRTLSKILGTGLSA